MQNRRLYLTLMSVAVLTYGNIVNVAAAFRSQHISGLIESGKGGSASSVLRSEIEDGHLGSFEMRDVGPVAQQV